MNNDKVSIVIVNWNNYKDTIECLKSLLKLQYKKYKIIIVDNNSMDNSVENLCQYCIKDNVKFFVINNNEIDNDTWQNNKIIIYKNDRNSGFAGGTNIGIKLSQQFNMEYTWLLNNDTEVEKDVLDKLLQYSLEYKNAIIGAKLIYYYNNNIIQSIGGSLKIKDMITGKSYGNNVKDSEEYNLVYEPDYINGASMFMPSRLFEEIGYFDEKFFLYWEETDLCFRAKNKNWKMVYCPEAKIMHKEGGTTNKVKYLPLYYYTRNCLYFYKKNNIKGLSFMLVFGYLFKVIKRIIKFKFDEINYINKAYVDFLKNRFGRIENL